MAGLGRRDGACRRLKTVRGGGGRLSQAQESFSSGGVLRACVLADVASYLNRVWSYPNFGRRC
jgi:hypothetical protein